MLIPEAPNLHPLLLSVYSAHTGFKLLFLDKALLRNNPPKLFHVEFLFSKLFKHVLPESFILAFNHLLSSIIVLKVKNLDSTIRRIVS